MKNILGQQLSEQMEKLYRYAVAPDGGLREAKMLAKANKIGKEFSDSINYDTSVIALIEHEIPSFGQKVRGANPLNKPIFRLSCFPIDKAYIKKAVEQGFYSIDIDVLFYDGYFNCGLHDLLQYQRRMNNLPVAMQLSDYPASKVSLMVAAHRVKKGSPKYKLMVEHSLSVVTNDLIKKFKKHLQQNVFRDYCTPDWSMIKFIFHH